MSHSMVFENVLANTLLITSGIAVLVSGLAVLAAEEVKWQWKKFLYTVGIATVSGLAIVETQFGGVVDEGNLIPVLLAITGASFLGNKLFGIGKKLNNSEE